MQHRNFGGYAVSQLGLGCASAWGQSWFKEGDAERIVHRALELGITVFDTGASYSNGNAEPRLGRILAKALSGGKYPELFISTKAGTHLSDVGKLYKDWTPAAIVRQVDRSRVRLGLETIPLLYLHGPKVKDFTSELLDQLASMQSRGWFRYLGVNSFDVDVLEAICSLKEIDVVMPDYNLMRIDREPLIARLSSSGKLVVGGAALANKVHDLHFLIPRSRVELWYLLRALKGHRQQMLRARRLSFLKRVDGWTPAQIAIAFAIKNADISASMFSTTRVSHLEENISVVNRELPDEVVQSIYAAFRA